MCVCVATVLFYSTRSTIAAALVLRAARISLNYSGQGTFSISFLHTTQHNTNMGANQSLTGSNNNNNNSGDDTNNNKTASTPDSTISAHVAAHQVVIFSKRTCGYCDAVKSVVAREARRLRRSIMQASASATAAQCTIDDAFVIELDDDHHSESGAELQQALMRRTGVSTVPQVFVGSRFVGGAVDTTRLANNGGLRLALIQAANCDGDGGEGMKKARL